MGALSKDQILAAEDLRTETVPIPEWGGDVIVSEMTSASRIEWETAAFDEQGKPLLENWKAKLVAACAVDETGDRMFTAEDVPALGKKADSAISTLYRAAAKLNGLGPNAVEEEAKN